MADIMESWESLAAGSSQLLKETSIYLVGDSTEINQKVAEELATGLGYVLPLKTISHFGLFKKKIQYTRNNYVKWCIFVLDVYD